MAGPGEQGNETTCCIKGREFNKITEQLLASLEGTVLHGVISNFFENCSGEILQNIVLSILIVCHIFSVMIEHAVIRNCPVIFRAAQYW